MHSRDDSLDRQAQSSNEASVPVPASPSAAGPRERERERGEVSCSSIANADLEVVIGPAVDLHVGIHGALLASPPTGISYARRGGTHVFLFPQGSAYPDVFETPHWGELVAFSGAAPLVHTAAWPALNARAWVVDMDDFGYPVLGGRAFCSRDFRQQYRQEVGKPGGPPADHAIHLRLSRMLRAYAHPSCRAILFWTKYGLDRAAQMISDLDAGADGQTFLQKARVLGPAMPPLSPPRLGAKWQGEPRMNVLFCGVGWQLKNGPLAIRVMAKLAAKHPAARFIYAGDTPPEYRDDHRRRALPPNLRLLGQVPHEHVKTLFEGAHILFHPSKSESFGMVLLEAAAAGLAIVCARGRGMEHLDEILDARGAATFDRGVVPAADEEDIFTTLLDGLLTDRQAARAMGMWNHARVETSMLSTVNRNAALASVYHRAVETAAGEGLREQDLALGADVQRLRSEELRAAEREFRARTGADALGFRVEVHTTQKR